MPSLRVTLTPGESLAAVVCFLFHMKPRSAYALAGKIFMFVYILQNLALEDLQKNLTSWWVLKLSAILRTPVKRNYWYL